MRRLPGIALSGLLFVAACENASTSAYNPMNWFSGSSVEMMEPAPADVDDLRPLVDQVLSMSVDPAPGGAIVRATGLPPTQGWWRGDLVADEIEGGRLNFRFVIFPPPGPTRVSTPQSRELVVAAFVSNRDLELIREITVTGTRSARSSRR